MNLTTHPWIPVVLKAPSASGQSVTTLVSLLDCFAKAEEIRDLAVQPHERIALLRLLICIAHAALDGPETRWDWKECRADIQPKCAAYLQRWEAQFELFGEGPRFLQVPGLTAAKEEQEGNAATKLNLTLASGNNATLFDNAAGMRRPVEPAALALALLTFQCFSPGGRIGVAKWNGADTAGKGSSNHAPCTPSSMLHSYIIGESLLDTLWHNLLNKDWVHDGGWGKPIWEWPVTSLGDGDAIKNATMSYLGRLVPLSRAIRLEPDGERLLLANGLDYPIFPAFREVAATVVLRNDEAAVLGVSLGRSIWRQLGAILTRRAAQTETQGGFLALGNVEGDQSVTLWVGALVTDKAKILDVVESSFDLPAALFGTEGRVCYESGVGHADLWSGALSRAVRVYAGDLKLDPVPYEAARHFFWTAVEQHLALLIETSRTPATAGDWPQTEWGKRVREAAYDAYAFACPASTPRQVKAFALGQGYLSLAKPKAETDGAAPKAAKASKKKAKASA